jgi:hypothetical protein
MLQSRRSITMTFAIGNMFFHLGVMLAGVGRVPGTP